MGDRSLSCVTRSQRDRNDYNRQRRSVRWTTYILIHTFFLGHINELSEKIIYCWIFASCGEFTASALPTEWFISLSAIWFHFPVFALTLPNSQCFDHSFGTITKRINNGINHIRLLGLSFLISGLHHWNEIFVNEFTASTFEQSG
jgi:hypothetical protein